jgi:homoserine dehydrogenase
MVKVNVALLGFGNVGRAFAQYVRKRASSLPLDINIRAISDSTGGILIEDAASLDLAIARKDSALHLRDFDGAIVDASDFLGALPEAGVDLLAECLPTNISTGEPALSLVLSALRQGISVVTVDKGPLVHGFEMLRQAARDSGVGLGYSGTTGVRIPDAVLSGEVREIRGVLNGTTNYVLSEMQQHGRSFEEALSQARCEGIAEPDPSLDIEGWDTAAKVLILARSLMGADAKLSDVTRIGIGPETEPLIRAARLSGRVVRLVGRARIWQGGVRVSVAPKIVGEDSPFYSVNGTSKAALFRMATGGEVLAFAKSGRDAIAEAIVEDIAKIASAT